MNKQQYLREIADRACLPSSYLKKILADLSEQYDTILAGCGDPQEVIRRMGDPDEVAAALYESYCSTQAIERPFVEYRSKTQLFGLPLVHIVKSRGTGSVAFVRTGPAHRFGWQQGTRVPTAKGIIAIGWRAKGVVAIGNFTCGIISLGNVSLGLLTIANAGLGVIGLGNLVMGLLFAFGNAAGGLFAIGNLALGLCAVGNAVFGQYALGREAAGAVAQSVKSFAQTGVIAQFITAVPKGLQGFFNTAVWVINNLAWLAVPLVALLVLGLILWSIIHRKMKARAYH